MNTMMMPLSRVLMLWATVANAFTVHQPPPHHHSSSLHASTATENGVESSVAELKRVLEREYISFFDPMKTEFYSKDVKFIDPLTSLAGVEAYRNNVDMLAGRTLLGKLLFEGAGINLHSIKGGEVDASGKNIKDIVTTWTLKMTVKILPWAPTARFTGISVYKVAPLDSGKVVITLQEDYWDSVNLMEGGKYQVADKGFAVQDFLNQLKPGGLEASSAAPELPYELLRRGKGYEVRRYPSFTAVQIPYTRRDDGFASLGSLTRGSNPLSPAIMNVNDSDSKTMMWPLTFALPGESTPPPPTSVKNIITVPERIVAIREYSDAALEPVVRKAKQELREILMRDGLEFDKESNDDAVTFAQYDAVFSMGKRRGEVWLPLKDGGHPW